VIWLQTATVFG